MRERSTGRRELRAFMGSDPLTGKPRQMTRTFHGSEKAAGKALSLLVSEVEAGSQRSSYRRDGSVTHRSTFFAAAVTT